MSEFDNYPAEPAWLLRLEDGNPEMSPYVGKEIARYVRWQSSKLTAAHARIAELEIYSEKRRRDAWAWMRSRKESETKYATLRDGVKALAEEIRDDAERDNTSDVQAGWTLTSRLVEIADQLTAQSGQEESNE